MLTDIFLRRYPQELLGGSDTPSWLTHLQAQLTHIFVHDLLTLVPNREALCEELHQLLARELGIFALSEGNTWEERCGRFLGQPYNLWNNNHGELDHFFKTRLSLVELAFRKVEEACNNEDELDRKLGGLLSWPRSRKITATQSVSPMMEKLSGVVGELNARLKHHKVPFCYHRGFIQSVNDPLTTREIEEPFWSTIADRKWKNVTVDMQEAIDRRDSRGRDSALYATKALESTIKIISDLQGKTAGNEKGASDYIQNLGRTPDAIIETWETELLRGLFSKIRNPHGHGPGSSPMPQLSPDQETWVLEVCMSWIKSLVRRIPI